MALVTIRSTDANVKVIVDNGSGGAEFNFTSITGAGLTGADLEQVLAACSVPVKYEYRQERPNTTTKTVVFTRMNQESCSVEVEVPEGADTKAIREAGIAKLHEGEAEWTANDLLADAWEDCYVEDDEEDGDGPQR